MGLWSSYKQLSFGRQLQLLFVSSTLLICLVLIIITKLQLDWLREYLIEKSEEILDESIKKQLRALGDIQSHYLSNEIQNYMSLVSTNKRSAEIFHDFNPNYPKNPFNETKSYHHSVALIKTYEYGIYYSRNTISEVGFKLIRAESCFNYFYPLLYRTEYLGYYAGFEIDEIYHGYPGRIRTRTYTPLVREWYYKAYQGNGSLIVTEPYVDFTTRMFVITISQAIMGKDLKPFGVTALDVTLAQITGSVLKIKILEAGFAILVSRAGMILTVPEFWKPEGQTDVTVKIFDETYTGLSYRDWEKIKNLTIGSTYSFVDSRKVSLVLMKQEVRPYFDVNNLTHYLFLCVESSELTRAKDYTIESFDETYSLLFWISLSFGLTVFTIISVLIYIVTENYSRKFKTIEKVFGGIVNRALFFNTTKNVDFDEMENHEKGMESVALHSRLRIDQIKNLEYKYKKFSYPHTRPNDVFIYEKIDESLYPFNYFTDKLLPWVEALEVLKRNFE